MGGGTTTPRLLLIESFTLLLFSFYPLLLSTSPTTYRLSTCFKDLSLGDWTSNFGNVSYEYVVNETIPFVNHSGVVQQAAEIAEGKGIILNDVDQQVYLVWKQALYPVANPDTMVALGLSYKNMKYDVSKNYKDVPRREKLNILNTSQDFHSWKSRVDIARRRAESLNIDPITGLIISRNYTRTVIAYHMVNHLNHMNWSSNAYPPDSCGFTYGDQWEYLWRDEVCKHLGADPISSTKIVFMGDSHTRMFFSALNDLLSGIVRNFEDIWSVKNPDKDFAVPDMYLDMCGGNKRYENEKFCGDKMYKNLTDCDGKVDFVLEELYVKYHLDQIIQRMHYHVDEYLLSHNNQAQQGDVNSTRLLLFIMGHGAHFRDSGFKQFLSTILYNYREQVRRVHITKNKNLKVGLIWHNQFRTFKYAKDKFELLLLEDMNLELQNSLNSFDIGLIDSEALSFPAIDAILHDHEHYDGVVQFAKAQILMNGLVRTPYLNNL